MLAILSSIDAVTLESSDSIWALRLRMAIVPDVVAGQSGVVSLRELIEVDHVFKSAIQRIALRPGMKKYAPPRVTTKRGRP